MAAGDITPARIAAANLRDRHMRQVVQAVSRSFRQPADWIMHDFRAAPIVRARWAAFYIAREIWGYPVREIAEFFRRDHTSIYHALVRADRRYRRDRVFRRLTDDAVREIWPTLPNEDKPWAPV